MNNVKDLIKKQMEELSTQDIPNLNEIEFLREYTQAYNIQDCYTYENLANTAVLGALLRAKKIPLSFEKTFEILEKCQPYLDEIKYDLVIYEQYFNELQKLLDAGITYDMILESKQNNNPTFKDKKLDAAYKVYLNCDSYIFTTTNEDEEENYDIEASNGLLYLFSLLPDKEVFACFLELEQIIDYIKCGITDCIDEIRSENPLKANFNMSDKEIRKLVKSSINKFMKHMGFHFLSNSNLISKYFTELNSEAKNCVKSINKKIKRLEELDSLLNLEDKKPLVKIDNTKEKMLFDSEIMNKYLMYVLKHNSAEYEKVEAKNIECNQNSVNKLDILFSKYSFSFNDLKDETKDYLLTRNNIDDIDSLLQLLKYSSISLIVEYEGMLDKILMNANSNMLKFIDALIRNGILTEQFILEHTMILYDINWFNRLSKNINYLNNIGISLVDVSKYNSEIYLLDSNELVNQTNMLEEYKIDLSNKQVYNFNMLENINTLDILDQFIELGHAKTIINNPYYLKSDGENIIKRIMISKLIGLSATNNSGKLIGKIATGNKFYVPECEYDNYIIDYKQDYQNPLCLEILNNNTRNMISASVKNIPMIKQLDELYKKDSLTYIINGVIISRKRVMRNLETLIKNIDTAEIEIKDLVFQAILFNMINNIEPETISKIYKSLSDIQLNKDKTYNLTN